MASSFPGAIDSFTDPLSGSALNSPSHSAQHADLNDAVEKVETYMGLVKVIPTVAGTGVTVSSTGTVTFTSATTVSVINSFSSVYANYRVILDIDTANSATGRTIKMRWRNDAGDVLTANYDFASQMSTLGTSTFDVTNMGNSATEMIATQFYGYVSQSAGFVIDVISPQVATKKTKHTGTVYGGSAAQNLTGTFQSAISGAASSHTGFSIYPSTGNITGTLSVYGYRN